MRIAATNWMQIEAYLERDDRCVLPLGSIEQHAYLSLAVDAILAERVAIEAAEPLGVPVYPAMPYGLAPYFAAYPGTVSLRVETLLAVVRDVVASLYTSGFRRVLIVSGHGGNQPVGVLAHELTAERPDLAVRFLQWWSAPKVTAKAREIDPQGSHASWFENFPWTRLADAVLPDARKETVETARLGGASPADVRALLGDGSFGGVYQKEDETMLALWAVGVAETREAIEGPWPNRF